MAWHKKKKQRGRISAKTDHITVTIHECMMRSIFIVVVLSVAGSVVADGTIDKISCETNLAEQLKDMSTKENDDIDTVQLRAWDLAEQRAKESDVLKQLMRIYSNCGLKLGHGESFYRIAILAGRMFEAEEQQNLETATREIQHTSGMAKETKSLIGQYGCVIGNKNGTRLIMEKLLQNPTKHKRRHTI